MTVGWSIISFSWGIQFSKINTRPQIFNLGSTVATQTLDQDGHGFKILSLMLTTEGRKFLIQTLD